MRPNRAAAAALAVLVLVAAGITLATIGAGTAFRGAGVHLPASATSTAGDGEEAGAGCGKERWPVKTGTDRDAARVDLSHPVDTSVGALGALPAPAQADLSSHGFDRIAPVEVTVYRVHATLVEYKRETDSDYHMVIADDQGRTMIAEIPAASCVGGPSPFRGDIDRVRQAFDAQFGGAEAQKRFDRVDRPVTVTGVGFFDFPHGQTGVAPNAIELHPVLSIAFG